MASSGEFDVFRRLLRTSVGGLADVWASRHSLTILATLVAFRFGLHSSNFQVRVRNDGATHVFLHYGWMSHQRALTDMLNVEWKHEEMWCSRWGCDAHQLDSIFTCGDRKLHCAKGRTAASDGIVAHATADTMSSMKIPRQLSQRGAEGGHDLLQVERISEKRKCGRLCKGARHTRARHGAGPRNWWTQ